MEIHGLIMQIWCSILKKNEDIFVSDRDEIFSVMETAFHCIDSSYRDGYLAMEEYVDGGCGKGKEEIPLWEYLRAAVRIVVDIAGIMDMDDKETIRMLAGFFLASQYTGCQAVQGCIYLMGASMIVERERADRALDHFRSLVPAGAAQAFDDYFQPVLDQWKSGLCLPE